MKGFNVVLAGLIFLLAMVSAVFSFFLFEKRSQLIDNYNKLGEQIVKTTAALDQNTKTGVSANVTNDSFSHSNSDNLPTALKNFENLALEVVKERDTLAKALVDLASTLENNQFDKSDFQNYSTYKTKLEALSQHVQNSKANHDLALKSIVDLARRYNISTSEDELKSGNDSLTKVVEKLNKAITEKENLLKTYVNSCSELVEKTTHGSFNPKAPKAGLDGVKSQYISLINSNKKLSNQVKNLGDTISKRNRTIADLEKEKKELENLVAAKEREIVSLHKKAGVPRTYKAIAPGSRQALDMIRTQTLGKVLVVDEKFGFITVSLGKKTYVVEKLKDGPRQIDPQIPVGSVLVVARNMPSGKAEYINQVKISKVDDFCSIAEPVDKQGGKAIMVGDVVYYSEKEIEKIVKNRKRK